MKITVTVSVCLDLEEAKKAGFLELADRMVNEFRVQGEDWQRQVAEDPLIQEFLTVKCTVHEE